MQDQIILHEGTIRNMMKELYDNTWREIQFSQFLKHEMINFSASRSMRFIDHVQEENTRRAQYNSAQKQENQPIPLKTDNLLPVSAELDENNEIRDKKMTEISIRSRIDSNNTLKLRQSKRKNQKTITDIRSSCKSLGMKREVQDQGIIKQLRKQHLQDLEKLEQEKKSKLKRQIPKPKKTNRDEKLSFNYDGQIVKIRLENRNNLVTGGMSGQTSTEILKSNPNKRDFPPSSVDTDKKDFKPIKTKKNDILFTQTRTLINQIEASRGVKLSEGAVIVENKEKPIPARELKKSISNRRLTKAEYLKIKQLTGNIQNFEQSLDGSKVNSHEKTNHQHIGQKIQEAKTITYEGRNLENTYRKKSLISVSDPQLLEHLISNPIIKPSENTKQIIQPEQTQKISKLDAIDSYNMEYIKKGGSIENKKNTKSVSDLLSTIRLPKLNTTHHQMPKAREKLKQSGDIVRQLRKKFQEKLRL